MTTQTNFTNARITLDGEGDQTADLIVLPSIRSECHRQNANDWNTANLGVSGLGFNSM